MGLASSSLHYACILISVKTLAPNCFWEHNLLVHQPQSLTASLCSDSEELTNRMPCEIVDGYPYVDSPCAARDGVADVLTVWCGDCGSFVRRHPLRKLVVFASGNATLIDLPAVPMHHEPWGEA